MNRKGKLEDKLQYTQFVPKSKILLTPMLVGVFIVPVSLLLWIFGILSSQFLPDQDFVDTSPLRWLVALSLPVVVSYRGLLKQSLDLSGAILGYFVGFILTLTNYAFLSGLLVFFLTSSWATRYKSDVKKLLEEDFKTGGQRNWIQVLCNGGVAAYLAFIYYIEGGSGEWPVDFYTYHRRSWLTIAILGALSCANGDTWASELATVLSKDQPRLITSPGTIVPKGTNGGVSLLGLAISAVGGLVIGLTFYVVLLLRIDSYALERTADQWPLIWTGLVGGLMGSLIDSLLGAIFQYSGLDAETGVVTETPRAGVEHISGIPLLDNHTVNLLSSFCTAVILPELAQRWWP